MLLFREKCFRNRETYQGKPRENQVEQLINHFDVNPEFAKECVRRPIDIVEVNGTMHSGEERTIKPTSPLRNQLRDLKHN